MTDALFISIPNVSLHLILTPFFLFINWTTKKGATCYGPAESMTGETSSAGLAVIKDEPVDLISHQTDDTSGSGSSSSYFGNNHLQYHHVQHPVQHHHHPGYYPAAAASSSFHHQQNPSAADGGGGYQRSAAIYGQPAGNSNHHHLIHGNKTGGSASISSPSPSPNGSSNSNGSYAGFGHHPHHPSAYSYHGSVAVPLPHHANSLHHQHQGGPAHHLAAGRFSVHHSPFAHHHRHQGQGGRVSVSTPPCSPQVVAPLETLNSAAHHHNQLQLHQHHHHPHLIHQPTPQQPQQPLMPAQTTSAGQQAGPSVKAKRGKYLNFKFLPRFFFCLILKIENSRRAEAMGQEESDDSFVLVRRMRQDVHEIVAPEGPPADAHGREAVPVLLEGMRMEIRPLRRAHPPLPQTHRRPALPVPTLRTGILQIRPSCPAHETTHNGLEI
jgi:hypothetical protein